MMTDKEYMDMIIQQWESIDDDPDLFDELMRKHINELAQLLADTQKHISYVILPISNRVCHLAVFFHSFFSHVFYLIELL